MTKAFRQNTVKVLSVDFVATLRAWFTKADWDEMCRRNRTSEYAETGCCASHDFCDANEAMALAFENVVGREPKANDDDDCALWSAAWELAKPTLRGDE